MRRARRPPVSMKATYTADPLSVSQSGKPVAATPLPVARTMTTTAARMHHAVTSSIAAHAMASAPIGVRVRRRSVRIRARTGNAVSATRVNTASAATFGAEAKNAVTGVGAPS